jgi:CheY-like chemotaxis protein
MLNKLSHEVESVGNGAEAVASADKQRFDLVLMDCQLPDIDGNEAARRIRAGGASAGVPVMALSTITPAEDVAVARKRGWKDSSPSPSAWPDCRKLWRNSISRIRRR